MTNTTRPRIAIIGAGPGGLTAARVLQQAGVAVLVYDADASLTERNQGGTLDLHADSGQIAIEDAGLVDEFAALSRPEGQSKRLLDPSGAVLVEHIAAADETAAPEIDRGQLRAMLAESLTPGSIGWDHRLIGASPVGDGVHRLTFEHAGGAQTTCDVDLVVGADGAWSKVRPLVSDATPSYTGVSFVELRFDDVDSRHPAVAALVGDGHMWANGDGRSIILQRNSGGHVRGYLGMRVELDWLADAGFGRADGRGGVLLDANGTQSIGGAPRDTDDLRAVLRRAFEEFATPFDAIITGSDGDLVNRPIFALPAPHEWEHRRGVTLLGDAAHVMAPFGGEGVNLAMLDGAELARRIIDHLAGHDAADHDAIDRAVRAYEQRMLPRASRVAVGANGALVEHFAAGGVDLDQIPDFDEESERWKADAAAYRAENG